MLYDLLRASSLSPGTLQGLHQLIGWLQCSDWASAQQQLNALVAASNMAEIAGFMPGIKSLLQIAAQMQVSGRSWVRFPMGAVFSKIWSEVQFLFGGGGVLV